MLECILLMDMQNMDMQQEDFQGRHARHLVGRVGASACRGWLPAGDGTPARPASADRREALFNSTYYHNSYS